MLKKIKCKFSYDELPLMLDEFLVTFFKAIVKECKIEQSTLDRIYENLVNEWEDKQ